MDYDNENKGIEKSHTAEVLWEEELHDDSNECDRGTDLSPAM
jgi:hypothetical protein